MTSEFKLIISNGLLWAYICDTSVNVFSQGNWLFSYIVPKKYSLFSKMNFSDLGNGVKLSYPNGVLREITLTGNQITDKNPFANEIDFKPIFSNSLLFRGDEDLPPITEQIKKKSPNLFARKGYPEVEILVQENQFKATLIFDNKQLGKAISYSNWLKLYPDFTTSNPTISELLQGSFQSLYKLRMFTRDGEIKAAGFPAFPSLFGRDFAISALGEIYLFPEKVREEAIVHLKHIGKRVDVIRGEKPGRAVHEFNYDNETMTGKYKHFPSWYANDSNALLLLTIFRLARIQNDFTIIEKHQAEIQQLWNHMLSLDLDKDGLIEYKREPGQLLIHQTWRDGGDEIRQPDDAIVKHPIAPLHDQLCMYGAMLEIFNYQWFTGKSPIKLDTLELGTQLNELKALINEKYWMNDLESFALALDGNNEQVKVVNSDVCFGYYFEAFEKPLAEKQYRAMIDSKRLLDKIGLRTISKEHPSYSPNKYQRGGVWPWQLAISIIGLNKYLLDVTPLMKCLENILYRGSIAEVYIPDQKVLSPLTSCIEQRWSATVPWLILFEGIIGLQSEYKEFPYTKNALLTNQYGKINMSNVQIRGEKVRIISDLANDFILQREVEQ